MNKSITDLEEELERRKQVNVTDRVESCAL